MCLLHSLHSGQRDDDADEIVSVDTHVCSRATTAAVIVAALTISTQATEQDPFYEILSSWQDNFKGNFCITAPQDLYGWKLKLKFQAPVSTLQV